MSEAEENAHLKAEEQCYLANAGDVATQIASLVAPTSDRAQVAVLKHALDVAKNGDGADNTLIFTGSADVGSIVTLVEAGLGVIGSTTTQSTGTWQVDATNTTLADGSYSFSAIATDVAGNTTNVSRSGSCRIFN